MLTDTLDVNPADIQFSLFTTPVSRGPHRAETCTLADLHNAIRAGHWWDVIAPVREIAPHKQEKEVNAPLLVRPNRGPRRLENLRTPRATLRQARRTSVAARWMPLRPTPGHTPPV